MSPPPDLSSFFSDPTSSRSDSPAQVPEITSSSPQLDTFNPGTGPSQLQPEFVGLRVVNEPEEERNMNDLRTWFLKRHRKRLYETIDIVSPLAKRVCPERAQEDPIKGASPSTMPQSNEVGPSAATATQPDIVGPNTAVAVQLDADAPSNAPAAKKAHRTERGPDVAVAECTPNEKSSPTFPS